MNAKLNVANFEQKVAFLCEMQGQISDGNWENASPRNHWEVWGALDWTSIAVDIDNVGRDFYAVKDNYNFTSIELLDIVGDRLLYTLQLAHEYEPIRRYLYVRGSHSLPESYEDWKRWVNSSDSYFQKKVAELVEYGMTDEMFAQATKSSYTRKQMVKDLQELKFCCRTKRGESAVSLRPVERVRERKSPLRKAAERTPVVATVLTADEVVLKAPAEVQKKVNVLIAGQVLQKEESKIRPDEIHDEAPKYTGRPVRIFDGIKIKFEGEGIYLCLNVGGNRCWIKSDTYSQLYDFMKAGYTPKFITENDLTPI